MTDKYADGETYAAVLARFDLPPLRLLSNTQT